MTLCGPTDNADVAKTAVFVLVCWVVVINTIYKYPKNSLLGMGVLVLGLPVYAFWARKRKAEEK